MTQAMTEIRIRTKTITAPEWRPRHDSKPQNSNHDCPGVCLQPLLAPFPLPPLPGQGVDDGGDDDDEHEDEEDDPFPLPPLPDPMLSHLQKYFFRGSFANFLEHFLNLVFVIFFDEKPVQRLPPVAPFYTSDCNWPEKTRLSSASS